MIIFLHIVLYTRGSKSWSREQWEVTANTRHRESEQVLGGGGDVKRLSTVKRLPPFPTTHLSVGQVVRQFNNLK